MGKIYDFDDDNTNEYIKFQAFLDQYDTSDTMKPGDTSVKMRKVRRPLMLHHMTFIYMAMKVSNKTGCCWIGTKHFFSLFIDTIFGG